MSNIALTNAMKDVKVNMEVTTDDVIAIRVAAREQELLASKKALTNDITQLKKTETQLGKDIEKAVADQLATKQAELTKTAELLKPYGVTSVKATTALNGNETKKVELTVTISTGSDSYSRSNISLGHSEAPNETVTKLLADKATTTAAKAEKQTTLSEVMNDLQNLSSVERQARSQLAQAKLNGVEAQPIIQMMLGQ